MLPRRGWLCLRWPTARHAPRAAQRPAARRAGPRGAVLRFNGAAAGRFNIYQSLEREPHGHKPALAQAARPRAGRGPLPAGGGTWRAGKGGRGGRSPGRKKARRGGGAAEGRLRIRACRSSVTPQGAAPARSCSRSPPIPIRSRRASAHGGHGAPVAPPATHGQIGRRPECRGAGVCPIRDRK